MPCCMEILGRLGSVDEAAPVMAGFDCRWMHMPRAGCEALRERVRRFGERVNRCGGRVSGRGEGVNLDGKV